MKAYIKQTTESSSFEQTRIGFIAMGYECIYYINTPKELTKEDILVGYITDVHKAFKQLGLEIPESIDYPEELSEYFGRKIEKIQFNDIFKLEYPYFIKPTKYKQFAGKVVREFKDLIGLVDTELYLTKEILDIVSEWRVFIMDGEILGVKHYKGDPFICAKKDKTEEIISKYKSAPNIYSLDLGILSNGETIVVEVNDGYSSGNYGLSELQYAKFLSIGYKQYIN